MWLTSARDDLQVRSTWPRGSHRCWWTPHPLPDLGRIHSQFRESAAKRIAVHAELFCGFTLIAAVTRKNLENVLFLKLAHRVGVSNPSGVHLEDEVVEFAFQSRGLPFLELWRPWLGSGFLFTLLSLQLQAALDPIRCRVLEMVETVKQTLFKI
jgi:hypothetical protein